ncbi:MAG: hypothetical protein EXS37_13165 [Opitutus sp.]|nr:hypothetical protein [Opitutus sp.]
MYPLQRYIFCRLLSVLACVPRAGADDWPQWQGPRADGIWREQGIVEKFPEGGPPVRWRTPIGAGYSSHAVANGRVFVLDRPDSETRGNPGGALQRATEAGRERVLCLDAQDGHVIWQHDRKFSDELTLYLVHGWLHLTGYDDLVPARKRAMRRAEARAMRVLTRADAIPVFGLRP